MIRFSLLLLIFTIGYPAFSQNLDTLLFKDFQNMVLENHPLIKRAELLDPLSDNYYLKALGALDPKVTGTFDDKRYDSKEYFRKWNTEVKVPSRYPIDLSVGYENNSGLFLNNEALIPSNGLFYGTLNVSVIRGLLFDEQRYNLQQAKLYREKNDIDKQIILNELIYSALNTYTEWSFQYSKLTVYEEALSLVQERHQNIVQLFINGDIPAIDTLESQINLNQLENELLEAQGKYAKAVQRLNLFLWDDSISPVQLRPSIIPETIERVLDFLRDLNLNQDFIPDTNSNPFILKYANQSEQLSLKNKLLKEDLKPQLDVKFNAIINTGSSDFDLSYNLRDYKVGASFSVPIRNRKTRSQISLNKIRMRDIDLQKSLKYQEIETKIDNVITLQDLNQQSFRLTQQNLQLNTVLLDAEVEKFNIGESSVFLINQRQNKLIKTKVDLFRTQLSQANLISKRNYLYFSFFQSIE